MARQSNQLNYLTSITSKPEQYTIRRHQQTKMYNTCHRWHQFLCGSRQHETTRAADDTKCNWTCVANDTTSSASAKVHHVSQMTPPLATDEKYPVEIHEWFAISNIVTVCVIIYMCLYEFETTGMYTPKPVVGPPWTKAINVNRSSIEQNGIKLEINVH